MNKREAGKLRKQRLAQIHAAVAARLTTFLGRWRVSEKEQAEVYRERDRQLRLAQEEYERNIAPKPRRSTREIRTSRFWRHFGQDGRPIPPWETYAGPGDGSDDDDDDGDLFAPGDYGYEDFDVDWGGYDYVDTGYDDENA